MPVRQELNEGRVPVKIYTGELEPAARAQLANISRLPIVHGHVAAMPDVHLGIGATVGSVIPTKKAIIPAAVGVDIGCGMNAVRTSLVAGKRPEVARMQRHFDETWACQIGTLGGGNHFIELCLDEAERVWIMLH